MKHLFKAAGLLLFIASLSACGGGGSAPVTPAVPNPPANPATPTTPANPPPATTPRAPANPGTPATPPLATTNMTVAADGSGDYKTLKDAFAAVADNSAQRTVITIKPGLYEGQAILTRNKHKVTLQGENAATTILSFGANVFEQPAGTHDFYKGHGTVIESSDFRADKLTFQKYRRRPRPGHRMGAHIKPAGWDNWGQPASELTARYVEYNSTGPGANPAQRVKWAKMLSAAEAELYTLAAVLSGTDGWKPE